MRIYKNTLGQTVYRLEKLTDFYELPEHCILEALEMFPIAVLNQRFLISVAASEGVPDPMSAICGTYIDFVDDGSSHVSFVTNPDGTGEVFRCSISKTE